MRGCGWTGLTYPPMFHVPLRSEHHVAEAWCLCARVGKSLRHYPTGLDTEMHLFVVNFLLSTYWVPGME